MKQQTQLSLSKIGKIQMQLQLSLSKDRSSKHQQPNRDCQPTCRKPAAATRTPQQNARDHQNLPETPQNTTTKAENHENHR